MSAAVLEELRRLCMPGDLRITWGDLVEQVAIEYGVSAEDVVSRSRLKTVAAARHHVWGVLRAARYSYPEIGRAFRRHHTTVMASLRGATGGPRMSAAYEGGFTGMGAGAGI